jgi:hypothetical protein
MKNKFTLGEYVSVEFMGRITKVEINVNQKGEEVITYCVDGGMEYAMRVPETEIYPAPTPENI